MNIRVVGEIRFEELERRIRDIPLMKKKEDGSEIYIYRDAHISFRRLHVNDVNPTTFYLLRGSLNFQRDLRETLLRQGIDTLNLDRAYEIENENGDVWTLMPPIIEMTPRDVTFFPKDGENMYNGIFNIQIPVITDGAHRISHARELGVDFTGVYISGVDPEFPVYAHPNDWSRVRVVDSVPETKAEKKLYSREDCYGLYRNFSILGCGEPRGTGGS